MTSSSLRQDRQVRNSSTYLDNLVAGATLESGATFAEDDNNALRSMALQHKNVQSGGNWYDALLTPSNFEGGAARGIDNIGQDLHELERKRLLRRISQIGMNVAGGAGQAVTLGLSEIPGNTTIAIGVVNTLGTVVATAGTFGTAGLDEVAGANALQPKNLVRMIDSTTRDPITDVSDREVYGLLQSESAIDGSTASGTTPNRLQISFVVHNGTGDDLELAAAGTLTGVSFDYANVERSALDDVPEEAFLGGSFVDAGASNATRESGYTNQGTAPVELATNADLDLATSVEWAIRDNLDADLLNLAEGSAGGTTTLTIGADVDVYQNSAQDVDFNAGVTANEGGTRPIDVGVADGIVEATAGDLELQAAAELLLDDGNRSGSTWASNGLKLSDTQAEWDALETAYGAELSLAAMLTDAKTTSSVRKVQAVVTANVSANNNVSGPATDNNLDVELGDLSGGNFVDDYDFAVNGAYVISGVGNEVFPGTSLALGQVQFNFNLQGVGQQDVILMFARA